MYKELREDVIRLNCNRCLSSDRTFKDDCHPIFCNLRPETETLSFKSLPEYEKCALRYFGQQYTYEWHEYVWGQTASIRLPIIGKASATLIVGEDLGLLTPIVSKKM